MCTLLGLCYGCCDHLAKVKWCTIVLPIPGPFIIYAAKVAKLYAWYLGMRVDQLIVVNPNLASVSSEGNLILLSFEKED